MSSIFFIFGLDISVSSTSDVSILIHITLEFHSLIIRTTLSSFSCDDFELRSFVSLTVRMDETRIDDTNQEDGSVDDISLFQTQYTRISTLQSLSVFTDDSVSVSDVPSSPTRSPLHLVSLSSEPLRPPYTHTSPNTAADGLGISSVSSSSIRDSVWDELLRELRQELFAEMRSLCKRYFGVRVCHE